MVFGTGKSASVNTYQIFLSSSSFQYATASSCFWKEKLLQCLRNASQRASNLWPSFTGEIVLACRGGCSLWFFVWFPSQLGKVGKSEYWAHSSYIVPRDFPSGWVVEVGSFLLFPVKGEKKIFSFLVSVLVFSIKKNWSFKIINKVSKFIIKDDKFMNFWLAPTMR